jgi:transposase
MKTWQQENIVRIKEEHDWTWKDMGIAVKLSADWCRQWYKQNKLVKEIGPVPKLPKKREIGGSDAVKVLKKQREEPRISLRKLAAWINDELGMEVSHTTVKDFLDQSDYVTVSAARRPILRAENKAKRLQFAQMFYDDVQYLRSVLWSDETSVSCYPDSRKIIVRVPRSEKDSVETFVLRQQGGGFKFMFWGCFSYGVLGPLTIVEGSINK